MIGILPRVLEGFAAMTQSNLRLVVAEVHECQTMCRAQFDLSDLG